MKKLLSLFLSIIMLVTVFAAIDLPTSAASGFDNAITMDFDTNYSNYANAGDVYYKITATQKGKLDIKFNHEYNENSYYWHIYIYKQNDDMLYDSFAEERYIYTYSSAVHIPSIGVNKGDTYFIKIVNGWNVENLKFTLSATFSKTSYFEQEFNNSFSSANKISLNNTYKGFSYHSDDYFKIVVPANGTLNIKFNHEYTNDSYYWHIYTYKKNLDGLYNQICENKYVYANNSSSTNINIGNVKKSETYYIKIVDGWNVGRLYYTLKPTLKIENPGTPKVTFSGSKAKVKWTKASGVTGYQVQITKDSKFKKIAYEKTTSKNYITKTLSYNTKYYVRVRAYKKVGSKKYYSSWKTKKDICNIKKLSTPKISVSKSKAKIKWSKSSGVSGYQVQVSTSKSFKKLKVNKYKSSASYTKTLSRKTKYYTRVRAYKKINGKKQYGKWSTVKSFKTK